MPDNIALWSPRCDEKAAIAVHQTQLHWGMFGIVNMQRRSLLVLALSSTAAQAGILSDTYRWRQKLTVMVDTPVGPKTGSAISEIAVTLRNRRGNRDASVTGEATVVEVALGKHVFALLSPMLYYRLDEALTDELAERLWNDVLPPARYARVGEAMDVRKEWGPRYAAIPALQGARELPVELWPTFVAFADVKDPRSVKVLAPDDFGSLFGQGVSLRSVTLEITKEEVTDGKIIALLPWLPGWKDLLIPVPQKPDDAYTPEERVRRMNFKREK
jgi:hypothetical protein